ncbi:MAG: hypothetical protein DMG55_31375 [Acidobacteria bacterium]|nr:MAG: hypothetical protein DMG55_31375 [Acidobacteriota bacterium]
MNRTETVLSTDDLRVGFTHHFRVADITNRVVAQIEMPNSFTFTGSPGRIGDEGRWDLARDGSADATSGS